MARSDWRLISREVWRRRDCRAAAMLVNGRWIPAHFTRAPEGGTWTLPDNVSFKQSPSARDYADTHYPMEKAVMATVNYRGRAKPKPVDPMEREG